MTTTTIRRAGVLAALAPVLMVLALGGCGQKDNTGGPKDDPKAVAEKKKEEKDENYYLAERTYGVFERALRLPETVDYAKVEARFDNGVLKVTAPKRPEAIEVDRKIEIK